MNTIETTQLPDDKVQKEETEEPNGEKDFIGIWEFSKVLPSHISALSQEEAETYISKRVIYILI